MMHKQTHILLTAFEPFGGMVNNITQEILNRFPEQVGTTTLHKVVLPVSFQRAPEVLRQKINDIQPNFVLMLGQCGEGNNIRLERYAHNLMDSKKGDNDGYCPQDEIIYANLPLALQTHCDIRSIYELCQTHHLPTILSSSAGVYVCNRVYFEALRLGAQALFIHVPVNFTADELNTLNLKLFFCNFAK